MKIFHRIPKVDELAERLYSASNIQANWKYDQTKDVFNRVADEARKWMKQCIEKESGTDPYLYIPDFLARLKESK